MAKRGAPIGHKRTRKPRLYTREGQILCAHLDKYGYTLGRFAVLHNVTDTRLSAWAAGKVNVSEKWLVARMPKELTKKILIARAHGLLDLAEKL